MWSAAAAEEEDEAALDGALLLLEGFRNFGWRFLGMWWPEAGWAGGRVAGGGGGRAERC